MTDELDALLSGAPHVLLRVTPTWAATYVSSNCTKILGLSRDEMMAAGFWERALSPDQLARLRAAGERLRSADPPAFVEFEAALECAPKPIQVLWRVAPDGDSGYVLYLADVTDRHLAEVAAARYERELRAITAASPDVITVVTPDLRVAFVSDATTALTGMRVSDRIGRRMGETVHPQDRPRLLDALRSILAGAADDFLVRVRTLHADGRYLTLEGHGRPALGSDGAPATAVVVFRDISDRVELEAELTEARDAANAASVAKSEFLSRMSHELRTPLNVVLGFAQLLQMEPLSGQQGAWVDEIFKAGRHLLDLINEVLDIARIETGALALSPETISLADVMADTIGQLQPIAAAHEVLLEFAVEDTVYVHADRQRLKQILLNLVVNGIKYNRPGGRVFVTGAVADEPVVEIKVNDTGIGIAPEHLERLFVPFDRLGVERLGVEGTGVGLPLTLQLVEAMDGSMRVESVEGEGSTFTVRLPVAEPRSDEAASAAVDDVAPDDDGGGSRGTLLYIEDNLANVQVMRRVLERRPGVRLVHAHDGQAGLDMARTAGVELIFLDVHLSDLSGADVLAELKRDPATSALPVYVVSADATPAQASRMLDAGATGYLTKPLDVMRVLEVVDRTLPGSPNGRRDGGLAAHTAPASASEARSEAASGG